jgi:hypothetical protein
MVADLRPGTSIVDVYMSFYNRQRRSMTAAKSAALRRFHTAMGTAGGATELLLMSLAEKGEMFVARVRYVLERGVRRRRWKAVLVEHPHPRVSLVASAWSNGRNGQAQSLGENLQRRRRHRICTRRLLASATRLVAPGVCLITAAVVAPHRPPPNFPAFCNLS